MKNIFVVDGLPKKFGQIEDNDYVLSIIGGDASHIENIYLPRDSSPMQALSGWAVVTLNDKGQPHYNEWTSKNVTHDSKTLKFMNVRDLIKLCKSSNLKGESLHISEYLLNLVKSETQITDEMVFDSLNNFYLK